jgi:hypothetical protein
MYTSGSEDVSKEYSRYHLRSPVTCNAPLYTAIAQQRLDFGGYDTSIGTSNHDTRALTRKYVSTDQSPPPPPVRSPRHCTEINAHHVAEEFDTSSMSMITTVLPGISVTGSNQQRYEFRVTIRIQPSSSSVDKNDIWSYHSCKHAVYTTGLCN